MTLNERFVGGNPRVLFLLFCLFCVVLICFVGICPNMMRKSEVFFEAVDQKPNPPHPKRKKKVFFSFKIRKENLFFFFSLIQKNTTSFILQTSISISIHHSKHKPQSKPTFIHSNTKFVHN